MDKVSKGPGGSGEVDLHQTLQDIDSTMQTFIESASVDKVYGRPIEVGDLKIITASENLVVMGFAAGGGSGSANFDQGEEDAEPGEGVGEGIAKGGFGGGRTLSRPVAVITASPEGVRIEPVADRTKVLMAAITAAGFVAGMFLRMSRGPKSF